MVCLCEDFETNIRLTKTVIRQPRNDGDRQKNLERQRSQQKRLGASILEGMGGAINGAFQSSRNLLGQVSDAQSGNDEADAVVDAVLFYDNAKEFSAYMGELQAYPHFFKPMWAVWPRSTVLQSAAAKIEVAKLLKRPIATRSTKAVRL